MELVGLADQTTTAALQVGTGCVVAEAEVMYIACARGLQLGMAGIVPITPEQLPSLQVPHSSVCLSCPASQSSPAARPPRLHMGALQVDVRTQHPVVHRLVRLRQAEHELLHHKLALHGPPVGAPVLDPLHRVAGGALTRQSEGGVLQVALTLC